MTVIHYSNGNRAGVQTSVVHSSIIVLYNYIYKRHVQYNKNATSINYILWMGKTVYN